MPEGHGTERSTAASGVETRLEELVPGARALGVAGDFAVDVVSGLLSSDSRTTFDVGYIFA